MRGILLLLACLSVGTGSAADTSAWLDALHEGDLARIQRLVSEATDLELTDESGRTALMLAAGKGDRGLLSDLIEAGADINHQNSRGGTALMYATLRNQDRAVGQLLAAGADPNAAGSNGWSALMIAAAKGYREIAAMLLSHGASVDQRDVYAWTPLMRAVYEGRTETVELLLTKADPDLSARDENGATALHHAAANNRLEIADLLLDHGAENAIRDDNGRTPRAVAMSAGHDRMVQRLRQRR